MSSRLIMAMIAIGSLAVVSNMSPTRANDDCRPGTHHWVWVGERDFNSIGFVCSRIYACSPEVDTMYPAGCERVWDYPPPRRNVGGVCSAGGGPVDSCNACLTNPPSDPCDWHWKQ